MTAVYTGLTIFRGRPHAGFTREIHGCATVLPRILAILLVLFAARSSAADLTLTIEPRWRGESLVVPSVPLRNDAGQTLRITRLAMLLSEAELLRADGSVVRLEGQFGFINAEAG